MADAHWSPLTPDQWPSVIAEETSNPQPITRGVDHYSDTLRTVDGTQRAQVLNVDLAEPNVRLGVVESHDHLTDTANELLTSMAHRSGAVAGVNGDFFEINGSGRPLGMVVIDGRLVKSPNPGWRSDLWVRRNGSIGIGTATYNGTLTDDSRSAKAHPITSVNMVNDLAGDALVRVTADLGTPSPIRASTVVSGYLDPANPHRMVVNSVRTGVTDLAQLVAGTQDLIGSGTSGQWLGQTVTVGDHLTVSEKIGPDNDVVQAVSGGAILVQKGVRAVPLQGDGENNIANPTAAVGVTKDGQHAVFAVFDGHQSKDVAQGLTRPQIAGWMMQHGAYDAILFDSGGSAQLVGRLPGQTVASVLNVPSDGHQRPVANGLFIYSTETTPGPAIKAVINNDMPLTTLVGTSVPVSAYATDRMGNPASDSVRLTVWPPGRASIQDDTLVVGLRPGSGSLRIRAGEASASVPLTVVAGLRDLALSPTEAGLINGATQQLSVTATAGDGQAVSLPPPAIRWTVAPASLGTVDQSGVFSAAPDGAGVATVTASAGGAHASSRITVGQVPQQIDPLIDTSKWSITDQYMNVYPRPMSSPSSEATSDGSLRFDSAVKRVSGDAGSFDVHYDYPYQSKTFDLSIYLNDPNSEQIRLLNGTHPPIGVGVWVKGNPDLATRSGDALAPGVVSLNIGIWQSNNQPTSFYPTGITFDGWRYVMATLPLGLQYPLRVNYLGLVVVKPSSHLAGDVHLSGLQALYSPMS
ncbi:MAG: phosphodiester glycosidase family protein [Candidatus Dormibacteraceae bacterium]